MAVHVLLRIEAKVAYGSVLESVLLDLACGKKAGRCRLEALCEVESTLRVREDIVTLCERDMVEVAVVRKDLRFMLRIIRFLIVLDLRCYVTKVYEAVAVDTELASPVKHLHALAVLAEIKLESVLEVRLRIWEVDLVDSGTVSNHRTCNACLLAHLVHARNIELVCKTACNLVKAYDLSEVTLDLIRVEISIHRKHKTSGDIFEHYSILCHVISCHEQVVGLDECILILALTLVLDIVSRVCSKILRFSDLRLESLEA